MASEEQICIRVWSDYVCPFCYLEEPILDRLQQAYPEQVKIEWRAFELRPDPVPTLEPNGEYLRTAWQHSVYPMAENRGMTLRLPPVQPRSRKALEAAEFARTKKRFATMHHALFEGFFAEGLDIGDLNVLLNIGTQVGLNREELRIALETNQFTPQVLEDETLAHQLGITGVPTMLIGFCDQPLERAVRVSGAQSEELLQAAVERVRSGEISRVSARF